MAILVDLQGPMIRPGKFTDGPHKFAGGDIFEITTKDVPGTIEITSTTLRVSTVMLDVGDHFLIDDGKVRVQVTGVNGPVVVMRVVIAGAVPKKLSRSGMTVRSSPGSRSRRPSRTSRRSSMRSTASWSPAATSGSSRP